MGSVEILPISGRTTQCQKGTWLFLLHVAGGDRYSGTPPPSDSGRELVPREKEKRAPQHTGVFWGELGEVERLVSSCGGEHVRFVLYTPEQRVPNQFPGDHVELWLSVEKSDHESGDQVARGKGDEGKD